MGRDLPHRLSCRAELGENLAPRMKALEGDRWEMTLKTPVAKLADGTLNVTIKDWQHVQL